MTAGREGRRPWHPRRRCCTLSEIAHYEDPDVIGDAQRGPEAAGDDRRDRVDGERLQPLPRALAAGGRGRGGPGDRRLVRAVVLRLAGQPVQRLPFISRRRASGSSATVGDPDGGGDEEEPWLIEEFGVTLEQLRGGA
jgi:hypothetical protein